MTRFSKTALCLSAVAALAATTLSTTAYAEYRCATPERLALGEKKACELARQDAPDALIHFVNRTKAVYGLYVNDYVSQADVERWDLARRNGTADSPAVAKAKNDTRGVSKAD